MYSLQNSTGDVTLRAVLLFSKLHNIFFIYFDPENDLIDNENKYFSGCANRYFG